MALTFPDASGLVFQRLLIFSDGAKAYPLYRLESILNSKNINPGTAHGFGGKASVALLDTASLDIEFTALNQFPPNLYYYTPLR